MRNAHRDMYYRLAKRLLFRSILSIALFVFCGFCTLITSLGIVYRQREINYTNYLESIVPQESVILLCKQQTIKEKTNICTRNEPVLNKEVLDIFEAIITTDKTTFDEVQTTFGDYLRWCAKREAISHGTFRCDYQINLRTIIIFVEFDNMTGIARSIYSN